jgi:cell division protein FtsA
MKENIIAGLDIGSTAIRLVVGQKTISEAGENVQILGAVSVPAEGINRGVVNGIDDATSAISSCLEKAERLIGVDIKSVWVGVNGYNLKCENSRGVVAVARSDNEITEDDVERAIEAAQALSVPPNYEILHVIPVKFMVDNQEDITDPVGMTGVRLEVETLIILGLSSQIKNLTKAIYRTGLEIEDLVLSPLAASEVVITKKQKELGSVLINIGAATTSLAVFEEGELLHAAVIPLGSEHITADVAIGLRCPITLADRVKLDYGSADPGQFSKKDEVDIGDLVADEELGDEGMIISKKYVAEIIEARVEEIFEKVDEELKKIDRSGMLPAGAFLIGGGAKLRDMIDVAKNKLRLPVCLGANKILPQSIDKVNDQGYLTALGLVAWGNQLTSKSKRPVALSKLGEDVFGSLAKKVTDAFKNLIP